MAVASAYLTDITRPEQRAQRFGLFNAMFGAGFIIGPVLGVCWATTGLRLPFIAAAVLNAGNLLLAWCVLPESRQPTGGKLEWAALNPLRPLRWVATHKALLPVTALFFILSATGEVYGTCWALWGQDAFGWERHRHRPVAGRVWGLPERCRRRCCRAGRQAAGRARRGADRPGPPPVWRWCCWRSRSRPGWCSPSCR